MVCLFVGFLWCGVLKNAYLNYKWMHCYAVTTSYYFGQGRVIQEQRLREQTLTQ